MKTLSVKLSKSLNRVATLVKKLFLEYFGDFRSFFDENLGDFFG